MPPPAGYKGATNKYDILVREDATPCARFVAVAQRALSYVELWTQEDDVTASLLADAHRQVRNCYLHELRRLAEHTGLLWPLHIDYEKGIRELSDRALWLMRTERAYLRRKGDDSKSLAEEVMSMTEKMKDKFSHDVDFEQELATYMLSDAYADEMRGLRTLVGSSEETYHREVQLRLENKGEGILLMNQCRANSLDGHLNRWGAELLQKGGTRRFVLGLWVTGAMREWDRRHDPRRHSVAEVKGALRSVVQALRERRIELNRWHVLGCWFVLQQTGKRLGESFKEFVNELQNSSIVNAADAPTVASLDKESTLRRSTDEYLCTTAPELWHYDKWTSKRPTQEELRAAKRPLKQLDELLDMQAAAKLLEQLLA